MGTPTGCKINLRRRVIAVGLIWYRLVNYSLPGSRPVEVTLKIGSALPRLLERRYPTVRPTYPLLTVLYLLRIQDIMAVPITDNGNNRRAVFGFSILPKLVTLTAKNFDQYLAGPCEQGSDELDSFGMDDDVEKLLESFKKTKLGVALVNGKVKGESRTSFVSLVDLLRLYKTKQMESDMVVEEVASPLLSMPGRSSVREAVKTMFKLRQRKVFIAGERMFVSDRSIVDRFLSPASLVRVPGEREGLALDARIDTLKKTAPIEVAARTSLHAAALQLRREWGPCLTIQDRDAVVTPWDVIMKPWESGRLTIRARAPA